MYSKSCVLSSPSHVYFSWMVLELNYSMISRLASSFLTFTTGVAQFVQKYRRNLKFLGSSRVKCTKFHTEDPQICATLQNTVTWVYLAPGICEPLIYHLIFYVHFPSVACLTTCLDNLRYYINFY